MMAAQSRQYWILKTEPGAYAWEDLQRDGKTHWDGVRNYQARNNLQAMKQGDWALIYHSVGPKELVGVAEVIKTAYTDPAEPKGPWVCVDIKPVQALKQPVHLDQLKADATLKEISLVKQSRLSVCPIEKTTFESIMQLAKTPI